MTYEILSLAPSFFDGFVENGAVSRALKNGIIELNIYNIRDYAFDKHHQVDDYAFGGGPGMVMKPEPLYEAITDVMKKGHPAPVVYFTPQGRQLNQDIVNRYKEKRRVILLCGQFKEIDQRIRDSLVTDEISIGDYVLSGGEIPAMAFIDSVTRLLDGALGDIDSAMTDSHQNKLLGTPHYTRPAVFQGMEVPKVLLSGNHRKIEDWRQRRSVDLTKERRPDLYYGNQ